jgi:hypothetical protein
MKRLALLLFLSLAGCGTPFSVSGGFFGASVTANFPEGINVPAQVVADPDVTVPVLKVPANAPVTSGTVPVTTANGTTTTIPVVVAPVAAPILAVPAK